MLAIRPCPGLLSRKQELVTNGIKHTLSNHGKSTEQKFVHIIGEDAVYDTNPVQVCELGLGHTRCLSNGVQNPDPG
jgi:hypothetical protein